MRIPEIQEEMKQLIYDMEDIVSSAEKIFNRLKYLQSELGRRSPVRRAPVTSTPVTPNLLRDIRAYAAANPTMSQIAIANVFNVNSGRVSEALRGKRK